jgi:hypothetical protein
MNYFCVEPNGWISKMIHALLREQICINGKENARNLSPRKIKEMS